MQMRMVVMERMKKMMKRKRKMKMKKRNWHHTCSQKRSKDP